MTREERENTLHCLKVMVEEANCEDCKLYGTTGTDHCERDCVRNAIQELEQETILEKIRAEIERHRRKTESIDTYDLIGDCLDIIDKYIVERNDKE